MEVSSRKTKIREGNRILWPRWMLFHRVDCVPEAGLA